MASAADLGRGKLDGAGVRLHQHEIDIAGRLGLESDIAGRFDFDVDVHRRRLAHLDRDGLHGTGCRPVTGSEGKFDRTHLVPGSGIGHPTGGKVVGGEGVIGTSGVVAAIDDQGAARRAPR